MGRRNTLERAQLRMKYSLKNAFEKEDAIEKMHLRRIDAVERTQFRK